jgi:hypothetical protein
MDPLEGGLHAEEVDELPEYRSVSGTAIVGLLLAFFAPLALIRPILIVVPIVAAVVCVAALARIGAARGKRIGKIPALMGLGLACLFAAAAPAQIVAFNRTLHARARPIAEAWLQTLQRREPHKAHQLTKPDLTRQALTDNLWSYYVRDEAAGRELQEFVENPAVKFLLTLGDDADVRFYEPYAVVRMTSSSHLVTQHFAVTYDDPEAGRTSFFVAVELERRDAGTGSGEQWRVLDFAGAARPTDL